MRDTSTRKSKSRTLLHQLQREVEQQSQFAMIALQDIETSLDGSDGLFFWYSVQNFLVSVGRISRTLWPEESTEPEVRAELRESLGVGEDCPFRDRSFLERYERFDRTVEDWYNSSESRRFFDLYTEPLDVLASTEPGDRFRGYDTEERTILLRGERYPTAPLARALEDLADRARREIGKPDFDTDSK